MSIIIDSGLDLVPTLQCDIISQEYIENTICSLYCSWEFGTCLPLSADLEWYSAHRFEHAESEFSTQEPGGGESANECTRNSWLSFCLCPPVSQEWCLGKRGKAKRHDLSGKSVSAASTMTKPLQPRRRRMRLEEPS